MKEWRNFVNAILYLVRSEADLGDVGAHRIAIEILTRPIGHFSPENWYQALREAIHSGEELDLTIRTGHAEVAKREFLTRIVAEMDALRPWPPPLLQELPMSRWSEFADANPIGRIELPWPEIESKIHKTFNRVDNGRQCLLVRLGSGVELGFLWPGSSDDISTTSIVSLMMAPPVDLLAEILHATSLDPNAVDIFDEHAE